MIRFNGLGLGHLLGVLPQSVTEDGNRWSPFARNASADCEAVAGALLAALDHEQCSLGELTPTRYAELRRKRPQMGLPRATTVTSVCGSWQAAVEAAERHAAAHSRRSVFA